MVCVMNSLLELLKKTVGGQYTREELSIGDLYEMRFFPKSKVLYFTQNNCIVYCDGEYMHAKSEGTMVKYIGSEPVTEEEVNAAKEWAESRKTMKSIIELLLNTKVIGERIEYEDIEVGDMFSHDENDDIYTAVYISKCITCIRDNYYYHSSPESTKRIYKGRANVTQHMIQRAIDSNYDRFYRS
jgi:hypothetical protein